MAYRLLGGLALLMAATGCASTATPSEASSTGPGSTSSTGGGGAGGTGQGGAGGGGSGGASCGCSPGLHTQSIYVLSDDAELWSYDPVANTFELLTAVGCAGGSGAFSMAVDPLGQAWVLLVDDHDIRTVDPARGGTCGDPGYTPDKAGFGLFGMAFTSDGPESTCARLYVHSYDGKGPFGEGPGAGLLGVVDPATVALSAIGPIDYDGGELAGTADGRLFAFAGVTPPKLVEYDKATAKPKSTTPLDGFHKTQASAFAFFGGDLFFFTEAPPAGCDACLDAGCAAVHAACEADPTCADDLACAIGAADITDACGGSMPPEMQNCLIGCDAECWPPPEDKVSQVTRMDLDGSSGPKNALEVVNPSAPIRIVGAGSSICVPLIPN